MNLEQIYYYSRLNKHIRICDPFFADNYAHIFTKGDDDPLDLTTVYRLAIVAEEKNREGGDHLQRMSHYSAFLAKKMGFSSDNIETIFHASPLHDIGKIGIPSSILLKKRGLTPEEFDIMKTHTLLGASILENYNSKIINWAEDIALCHHENVDGSGYPQGLKREEIPLISRIVKIADIFDALTTVRPYKEAYTLEYAVKLLLRERGVSCDKYIVDLFYDNIGEIEEIYRQFFDKESIKIDFRLSDRDTHLLNL